MILGKFFRGLVSWILSWHYKAGKKSVYQGKDDPQFGLREIEHGIKWPFTQGKREKEALKLGNRNRIIFSFLLVWCFLLSPSFPISSFTPMTTHSIHQMWNSSMRSWTCIPSENPGTGRTLERKRTQCYVLDPFHLPERVRGCFLQMFPIPRTEASLFSDFTIMSFLSHSFFTGVGHGTLYHWPFAVSWPGTILHNFSWRFYSWHATQRIGPCKPAGGWWGCPYTCSFCVSTNVTRKSFTGKRRKKEHTLQAVSWSYPFRTLIV